MEHIKKRTIYTKQVFEHHVGTLVIGYFKTEGKIYSVKSKIARINLRNVTNDEFCVDDCQIDSDYCHYLGYSWRNDSRPIPDEEKQFTACKVFSEELSKQELFISV